MSLSIDFYCRVFVKVRTGQRKCKESTSKLGHVYQCFGCESLAFQPLGKTSLSKDGTNLKFSLPHGPPVDRNCKFCSHSHHIGGPIWLAPIHNVKFVEKLLDSLPCHLGTIDRLVGMLSMVLEELEDVPLYYELTRVCNITKQSCGKLTTFLSAVLNAGYRVSLTHANRVGVSHHRFLFIMIIFSEWHQDRCSSGIPVADDARLVQEGRQGGRLEEEPGGGHPGKVRVIIFSSLIM